MTIPYYVTDPFGFLAALGITATGELYWATGTTPLGDPIKTFDLDVTAGQHQKVFTAANFADIQPRPEGATGVVSKLKLNTSSVIEAFLQNNIASADVPLPDLIAGEIGNRSPDDPTPVVRYTTVNPGGLGFPSSQEFPTGAKAVSYTVLPGRIIDYLDDRQSWDLDTSSGEHELELDSLDWDQVFNPSDYFAGLAVYLDGDHFHPSGVVAEQSESNNLTAIFSPFADFRADGLTILPDGTGARLSYTYALPDGVPPPEVQLDISPRVELEGVPLAVWWTNGTTPLGDGLRFTLHPADVGPNEFTLTPDDLYRLGPPPAGATGLVVLLDPNDEYVEPNEDDNWAAVAVDTAAPVVTGFYVVYADGSRYDLATASRLNLPWKITGIQVAFSKPVHASEESLGLDFTDFVFLGTPGPPAGAEPSSRAVNGFAGDGTSLLSWTLAGVTLAEVTATLETSGEFRVRDRLFDIGLDAADTSFVFSVVVGDVTGDRRVLSNDRTAMRQLIAAHGYSLFYDLNGDGVVDTQDLAVLQANLGSGLV